MAKFSVETTSDEAAAALSQYVKGKTVIITGVSPGSLGADSARALAIHEPRILILVSRSESNITKVIEELGVKPSTTVKALKIDLVSQASVRAAAAQVLEWTTGVDAIIETAGVMAVPEYQVNGDGLEMTFAANHIGHFLFTNLLMPRLLAAKGSVVPFTSEAPKQASLDLDNINYDDGKTYQKWAAYGQSKAANILFAVELAKRYGSKGLRAFLVDPEEFKALGWVDENGSLNTAAFAPKSAAQGSASGIIAAFDPSIAESNGSVLESGVVNNGIADAYAMDAKNAEKLWGFSENIVGQTF